MTQTGDAVSDSVEIGPCSPFLIVEDVARSLAFYVDGLEFECRYAAPESAPFFAIVGRGAAQIMLKCVGEPPLPNRVRHRDARWDVFVYVADPDVLADGLGSGSASLNLAVADTHDGLRGFEVVDPDGYVCFFGHPI